MLKDSTVEREVQKQLLHFERLSAIGQTAAGLAHEVRNPLAVITTNAEYLKRQLVDRQDLHQDLDAILRQSARLKTLVKDMLEQHRSDALLLREQLVRILFEGALRDAKVRYGLAAEKVRVAIDLDDPDLALMADGPELQRALTNLVLNGLQALSGGGNLTLRARAEPARIVLEVEDDGPGIAPDHLLKLLEPFYTTKETGSGLGLWVCKSVVEKHGGSIEAVNLKPRGACFRIRLPHFKKAVA